MSKKLAAKNALIEMPGLSKPAIDQEERSPVVPRTRTAVGGMAQFVATQSPIHREAEELREAVKSFEGAHVVRALSPASVIPSEWANRHEDTFDTPDFAELKREIKEAGGNVQAIKVRPLNGSTPKAGQGAEYEIVFGHRRHRACLELNIPVNALIEAVDDQKLFEQMERENRGRKNLSAWEQGCMYQAALKKGLYSSQRKLSESIGVDISLISKSLALAKLPKSVIEAFPSPLDIQFRWAQPLWEALQKDEAAVIAQATALTATSTNQPLSAGEIFARLTAARAQDESKFHGRVVQLAGKKVGQFSVDNKGGIALKLHAHALAAERREAFLKLVEEFLQAK